MVADAVRGVARSSISSRVRQATAEYAAEHFPLVVVSLALKSLRVTMGSSTEGSGNVLVEDDSRAIRITMVASDFFLLRDITSQFSDMLSPFPSEPLESVVGRIRAIIRVRFAGRGGPNA